MTAALSICRSCQAPVDDPEARYCENCGRLLDGAAPAAAAPRLQTWSEAVVDDGIAVVSDTGRRHRTNQDRGLAVRRQDGAVVLAVADGVSHSDTPERAAEAAMQAVEAAFATATGSPGALAEALVAAAVAEVGALRKISDDPLLDPPETTIVVAVIAAARVGVAWVGDSRAYLLQGGVARGLTRDDSWAEEMVTAGMDRAAAMADPNAHAITACLGMPEGDIAINRAEEDLPAGAGVLLATDGLWNYFDSPEALGAAFAAASQGTSAAMACRALVAKANACGGIDNITVAIALPAAP